MEKFQGLQVWGKMHRLVLRVYHATDHYPDEEKFGLVSQMRRAAVSVNANIAEGSKRASALDRNRFHVIADASLEELKYYFILSADLDYVSESDAEPLLSEAREVGSMLSGLIKAINNQIGLVEPSES